MDKSDQNFDSRKSTFKKNIYGTSKGKVREAILKRDLDEFITSHFEKGQPLNILDIGGGQGQIALYLAKQGHQVVLTDISGEMLEIAKVAAKEQSITNIQFAQVSLQECRENIQRKFDLVLCHAVFEWLEDPESAFKALCELVRDGGLLSFMYYNHVGQSLSNLVYGNFEYIKAGMKGRKVVKLNPQSSLKPDTVKTWLYENNMKLLRQSGVRCFHDYMRDIKKWDEDFDGILEMELEYSLIEPYNQIGRYTHLILKK